MESPVQNRDIGRLIIAFVKTGTSVPMKRQKPMPIEAFVTLFKNLGDNHCLSLQGLRMKAVTLLALCAMTRPSDIAPKGKKSMLKVDQWFLWQWVGIFETDGSMTAFSWNKEWYRQSFEVHTPSNSENPICWPVECLRITLKKLIRFILMEHYS